MASPLLYIEFRAGVTACLRSWSALRTAVEQGWGGRDSEAKAEALRSYVLQHLDGSTYPPQGLTQDDLEDAIAVYMEEEFSVVLEDNSERQVADTIFRMYEECFRNHATLMRQVLSAAQSSASQAAAYPVHLQSMEEDDDDSDDGDANNDEVMKDMTSAADVSAAASATVPLPVAMTAAEYAEQPLFGANRPTRSPRPARQLGDHVPEKPQTEVDEDGFAPVTRKGRR